MSINVAVNLAGCGRRARVAVNEARLRWSGDVALDEPNLPSLSGSAATPAQVAAAQLTLNQRARASSPNLDITPSGTT